MTTQPIPTTLVTGFLGSGKTTLLRHAVTKTPLRPLALLINEFASRDIDAQRLASCDALLRVVAIPGGSIFCQCKVTALIEALSDLIDSPHHPRPHGLFIEASGMADPRVFRRLLVDTRLDRFFAVRRIVGVVDPITWPGRGPPAIAAPAAAW